jgi:hypothetical protein
MLTNEKGDRTQLIPLIHLLLRLFRDLVKLALFRGGGYRGSSGFYLLDKFRQIIGRFF